MTESLTAAAACGNPVHFEGTEKRLNSAIEQMHLSGLMKKRLSKCTDGEKKRVRIAREITKGAENYFILNPIAFEDENSKKIILGWMETIWFSPLCAIFLS